MRTEKIVGALFLILGTILFFSEFYKTKNGQEIDAKLLGLNKKDMDWGRSNILWRGFGLIIVGLLLLIFEVLFIKWRGDL